MGTVWAARVSDAASSSRQDVGGGRPCCKVRSSNNTISQVQRALGRSESHSNIVGALGMAKDAQGDFADCFFLSHVPKDIWSGCSRADRLPESHAGSALHQGILQTVHGANSGTV